MFITQINFRNLILLIALFSAGAIAQPLPPSANWGVQRIHVAGGCSAFSMLPNDPAQMTVEWRGPCIDGLAHGDGVHVIRMQSIPMSVSQARYKNGRLASVSERYYFELGVLFRRIGSNTWTPGEKGPFRNVPEWAREVIGATPLWAEWRMRDIERRRLEMAAMQGNPAPAEDELELEIQIDEETVEKKPEDRQRVQEAPRVF